MAWMSELEGSEFQTMFISHIHATERVCAGEEILVNYGQSYFKNAARDCLCTAHNRRRKSSGVRLRSKLADALDRREGPVCDPEPSSPHGIARIDAPVIQYIQGILPPAYTDTRDKQQDEQCAKHYSSGLNSGPLSPLREAVPPHHTPSLVAARTESTTEISLSRAALPGLAEAEADKAGPKLADDDAPSHSAPSNSALSSAMTVNDLSIGSDAHQEPVETGDGLMQHSPTHDDRARRYVQLPVDHLPHHVAFDEIQHIRELLRRPRGKYWLYESPDHLRCPHCPWTLDRARCRPFSNLGAPRKYGDVDEAKAGRAKVRKVARQKKLELRRKHFWAAIREEVGHDEYFMTQSAWWREIARLKRQRDDLRATVSNLAGHEEPNSHQEGVEIVIQRIIWCEDRVRELKRIVHT
ncbi:hypothetical protein DB88DRAFT_502407 [Papiliotrema laurentii]|uniref:SET domain-containing protein n=1 Tax=Papiliotrema laurentii TaxID=5418 RepID=A0AAD9CUA7_PAPLA|nr:hypothetical protein DB88DRAFT_503020 [Papiliotrema laurentii]KAK1920698.1 hypothetical protein DB88DRAFT_502407 [Papiliotrema laurentii]